MSHRKYLFMDVPVLGVVAKGPLVGVVSGINTVLAEENDAEVVVSQGTPGIEPQGFPEVFGRLGQVAIEGPHDAEVAMGRCRPGIEPEGQPEVLLRLSPVTLDLQDDAEVVVRGGRPEVLVQDLLIAVDRLVPDSVP